MASLLYAATAAKRAGMSPRRFRAICRAGHGPAVFCPLDGGRPMYVDTVVDAWLEARDDRPDRKVS